MKERKQRVLVVGAGPAGSSTAYFLKKMDRDNLLDVDLVERLQGNCYHSYHDICGEVVNEKVLDELKLPLREGVLNRIDCMREHWPGDIILETKIRGLMIDRGKFFQEITEKFVELGGSLEAGNLLNIKGDTNYVKVVIDGQTRVYDYVVGADGANSIVRKSLDVNGLTKPTIQFVLEEPKDDVIDFFYDEIYDGDYKSVFPHGENTKVCFPFIKGFKYDLDGRILSKNIRQIGFGGLKQYTYGNIFLVGDAACQTNPLTKGGIRIGITAGKSVAEAITKGDPALYEKRLNESKLLLPEYLKAFNYASKMKNDELYHHMKPFENYIPLITELRCILSRRKYLWLYKAYQKSNKYGW